MSVTNLSRGNIGFFYVFTRVFLCQEIPRFLLAFIFGLSPFGFLGCAQKNVNTSLKTTFKKIYGEVLPPIHRVKEPNSISTIVLKTFTGTGSQWNAERWIKAVQGIVPFVLLEVFEVSHGHVVGAGRYKGLSDPLAQSVKVKIKRLIAPGGQKRFSRAFLSKISSVRDLSQAENGDLWTVRVKYPEVQPIYTLDIAEFAHYTPEGIRILDGRFQKKAEDYCLYLRSQGYESYFYHSPDRCVSVVTVGLFTRRDIDQETGVWGERIETFLESFPVRFVNGQDRRKELSLENSVVQDIADVPILVEVPMP